MRTHELIKRLFKNLNLLKNPVLQDERAFYFVELGEVYNGEINERVFLVADVNQKVVIPTGASSGIGEAAAKELAAHGARLVLAARREDRLQHLQKAIENEGGEATYKVTDVSDQKQMDELAQFTLDTYGKIDVLINNAGLMPLSFLSKRKIDEWDRMVDVNIKGVLYGIAAVLPPMRERKQGHTLIFLLLQGMRSIRVVRSIVERNLLFGRLPKG